MQYQSCSFDYLGSTISAGWFHLYCAWLSSSRNSLSTNFSNIFLRVIMPVTLLFSSYTMAKFMFFYFSWSIASSSVRFSLSLAIG